MESKAPKGSEGCFSNLKDPHISRKKPDPLTEVLFVALYRSHLKSCEG